MFKGSFVSRFVRVRARVCRNSVSRSEPIADEHNSSRSVGISCDASACSSIFALNLFELARADDTRRILRSAQHHRSARGSCQCQGE